MTNPFGRLQAPLAQLTLASEQTLAQEEVLLTRLTDLAKHLALPEKIVRRANESALATQITELTGTLAKLAQDWQHHWQAQAPMRRLSEQLADRVVVLVYGKVNAGKSSLINYLTEQLSEALNVTAEGFVLTESGSSPFPLPLAEGATETTRAIAGVLLGKRLALLDTPGLHSATAANGELARQFTNAADALLWITPATNPGLVQELEALSAELSLGKPLLPVISRSDTQESSWDPQQGGLVQKRVPKSQLGRQQQQDDLLQRTLTYLAGRAPVQPAISLSVSCAKLDPNCEHGMDHLAQALAELTQHAVADKPTQWQRQLDYFEQRSVRDSLYQTLLPALQRVRQKVDEMTQELEPVRRDMLDDGLIALLRTWSVIVEQHRQTGNQAALLRSYQEHRDQILYALIQRHLSPLLAKLPTPTSLLQAGELGQYQLRYRESSPNSTGRTALKHVVSGLVDSLIGRLGSNPLQPPVSAPIGDLVADVLLGPSAEPKAPPCREIDSAELLRKGTQAIEQDLSSAIDRLLRQVRSELIAPLNTYLHGVDVLLDELGWRPIGEPAAKD